MPQDEHLSAIMREAERALRTAGLSAEDIVAALPTARAEVVEEAYGVEFLAELSRLRVQNRQPAES